MKSFTDRWTRLAAASLLLGAVACSVGLAEKHWQLAEEFQRQGQYLRAVEEYSRIVNFGHRSPLATKAELEIARIYEENLKDYPRSIRAYRDVVRRADDSRTKMEARRSVARIYLERLQNPGAAADELGPLFEEYGRFQKEGPDILLTLAKALTDAGRFSDSSTKYELFRQLYPGHRDGPRTLIDQGHALLADRSPDQAAKCFRELIEKVGNDPQTATLAAEAYYGLGNALEANDDLPGALAAYRQSLATYPNPKVIQLKIERVEKRRKERRL